MFSAKAKKSLLLLSVSAICLMAGTAVFAGAASGSGLTVGGIAGKVLTSVPNLAKLITALAYIAGLAFGVAAIVQFKAHKDNPTQVQISKPIALLFVGAALIFLPSVFKSAGGTMGLSTSAGVSGITNIQPGS